MYWDGGAQGGLTIKLPDTITVEMMWALKGVAARMERKRRIPEMI